jgi:hypothetical protein
MDLSESGLNIPENKHGSIIKLAFEEKYKNMYQSTCEAAIPVRLTA